MKRHLNDGKNRSIALYGSVVLLLVVIGVSIFSLFLVRRVLLENAAEVGGEVANSYTLEEERNLEFYESLITMGSEYLEGFAAQGAEEDFIEKWMEDYLVKIAESLGDDTISPVAVIDGKMIAAKPWDGIEQYDTAGKEWYQKAVAAGGEIIYTDVYTDTVYDKPVITIAKACGNDGDVIAFDVYPENFRVRTNSQELPEGSIYVAFDSAGNLLFEETQAKENAELDAVSLQDSYSALFAEITDGSVQRGDGYYLKPLEREMSVYYKEEQNGWLGVLLMPDSYLIANWELILCLYIGFMLLIVGAFAVMWLGQRQMDRESRVGNETVHILGNSYYAFYRVNINKGTYDMIKGSEYVHSRLPRCGNYQDLLDTFRDVIEEDAYQEFAESFSLENIRRQIKNNVEDFGGDFLRLFGEEWKWVNVHIMFSPSLNKEVAVLCFRSIGEERERQLERMTLLKASQNAADEGIRSQKKFFAGISHDMRTPLNVIINMSEMAGKNIDDKEGVREYLDKINYSSRQMLELINRILEMSRTTQDGERFDLCAELEKSVGTFALQAKEKKKQLDLTCHVQNKEVFGNREQLEQVMKYLISSTLQLAVEGERIFIELKEIENQEYKKYQIVIWGSEGGRYRDLRESMEPPEGKGKRFGVRKQESIDMVMLIARNQVALMGGEMIMDSEPEKGSRITIVLPFDAVKAGEKAVSAETDASGKEETLSAETDAAGKEEALQAAEVTPCLDGKRILLAEDYELNMEIATEILSMRGAEVTRAWNGKEALDQFAASKEGYFEAVLMDIQMPEMDGCEAAEAIRALDRADAKTVPIIAVTANAFSEDIARTVKAGMNAHIAKPIDFDILSDTLIKLWEEKR